MSKLFFFHMLHRYFGNGSERLIIHKSGILYLNSNFDYEPMNFVSKTDPVEIKPIFALAAYIYEAEANVLEFENVD